VLPKTADAPRLGAQPTEKPRPSPAHPEFPRNPGQRRVVFGRDRPKTEGITAQHRPRLQKPPPPNFGFTMCGMKQHLPATVAVRVSPGTSALHTCEGRKLRADRDGVIYLTEAEWTSWRPRPAFMRVDQTKEVNGKQPLTATVDGDQVPAGRSAAAR
jgi:hypothetical protein